MTARGLTRFTAPGGASSRADVHTRAPTPGSGAGESAIPGVPDGAAQVLARFARPRRQAPGETCELCSEPVPEDHRHVVDLERRALLCSCRGCALLFTGGTAQGRYRTVPDRYLRIEPFDVVPQSWAALQIPVGVAFVVHNSRLDQTVAFYPSPGGATESELPLDAWQDVVTANPGLEQVEPDVEAVLVRTGPGCDACFVVPVDRCYELVGALRMHWRGFDGGQEVRERIAAFFADVERRSRPATSVVHPRSGPLTRPRSKVLRAGEQPPQAESERPLGRDGDRDEARASEVEV